MDYDNTLTEIILGFQAGNVTKAKAILETTLEVYKFLKRYNPNKDEENQDFVASVFEIIPKLVVRFTFNGKPFQHYLYNILKWRFIDYRRNIYDQERIDRLLAFLYTDSSVNYESPETQLENQYSDASLWNYMATKAKISPAWKKRLLSALLLCADSASISSIEEFCRQVKVNPSEMDKYLIELRDMQKDTDKKYEEAINKYSRSLIELWKIEVDICSAPTNDDRQALYQAYQKQKNTVAAKLHALQTIRRGITHEQVSEVIGVPKGTIDSGMHYLKRNLAVVYNAAHGHTSRNKQWAQEKRTDSVVAEASSPTPRRRRTRRLGA